MADDYDYDEDMSDVSEDTPDEDIPDEEPLLPEEEEDPECEEDKEEEKKEEEDEDEEVDVNDLFESTIAPLPETKSTTDFLTTLHTADKDPERRTLPILNKYEKAKIIGIRAQQIAQGATPFIDLKSIKGLMSPLSIAEEELRQKRTPLIVRRTIYGKCTLVEDWYIQDLIDPFEDL